MVQIKLEIICGIISQESFISHMVQIKLPNTVAKQVLPLPFISHMVQIKPSVVLLLSSFLSFISHMVQIKQDLHTSFKDKLEVLYIPHGSDKTGEVREALKDIAAFISHMVQIKPLKSYVALLVKKALYPTWFR